jgi:hypothetical protein
MVRKTEKNFTSIEFVVLGLDDTVLFCLGLESLEGFVRLETSFEGSMLFESFPELVDLNNEALDLLIEDVLKLGLLFVHFIANVVSSRSKVSPFLVKGVLGFMLILVQEVTKLGSE